MWDAALGCEAGDGACFCHARLEESSALGKQHIVGAGQEAETHWLGAFFSVVLSPGSQLLFTKVFSSLGTAKKDPSQTQLCHWL